MSNQVYISQDANEVNLVNTDKQIIVTEIGSGTSVNVTQPITSTIKVVGSGPQGGQGDQGIPGPSGSTQPFTLSGSIWASTSSLAASGSFSGSFFGDGSQLTGIISSKWTGSNPISRQSDVTITGSLKITGSFSPPIISQTQRLSLSSVYTASMVYQSDGESGYYVYF
jgi:hypothetical protein